MIASMRKTHSKTEFFELGTECTYFITREKDKNGPLKKTKMRITKKIAG
jgi:hypothetical protein